MNQMIAKSEGYNTVLKDHGFKYLSSGEHAWSHRHTNESGTLHIDTRFTEWTAYNTNLEQIGTGTSPDTLASFIRHHELELA